MRFPASPGWWIGILRHRVLERPLWRWWYRRGLPAPSPELLRSALPYGKEPDWLDRFGEGHRAVFGWGPADRARFLTRWPSDDRSREGLLRAAENVVTRTFDVLGSGPTRLATPIDWTLDFKSGHRFPTGRSWRLDYRDLGRSSDVKVPWEVARFHFAPILAQAYWVTGDERFAAAAGELLDEWLTANPPGEGIHWANPMELAIRAVNLAFAFGPLRGSPSIEPATWARMLASLQWHGRVIRANLEYGRRLGNHYIADLTGLVVLGALFRETAEGRRWLRFGVAQLQVQSRWQVHRDGMSYEKSVGYHRLVLELFLIALVVGDRAGIPASQAHRQRLERMVEYTRAYTRADGSSPLISDADDGRVMPIAPWRPITDHRHVVALGGAALGRADLWEEAREDRGDAWWVMGAEWDASGLVRSAPRRYAFPRGGAYILAEAGHHLFLDAGPLGFEGDLVHGHLDTLSLELATPGGPILADSGCYGYTADVNAYREHTRTAAHNTVVVDGADQAELTGLWRVSADGTSPRVRIWSPGTNPRVWEAEHRGFSRLAGGVVHRRRVEFDPELGRWTITDQLLGRGVHRADVYWHAAPGVTVVQRSATLWELVAPDGVLALTCDVPGVLEQGWCAPRYGHRLRVPVIKFSATDTIPFAVATRLQWRPNPQEGRSE